MAPWAGGGRPVGHGRGRHAHEDPRRARAGRAGAVAAPEDDRGQAGRLGAHVHGRRRAAAHRQGAHALLSFVVEKKGIQCGSGSRTHPSCVSKDHNYAAAALLSWAGSGAIGPGHIQPACKLHAGCGTPVIAWRVCVCLAENAANSSLDRYVATSSYPQSAPDPLLPPACMRR